jgi:hypothetical protein
MVRVPIPLMTCPRLLCWLSTKVQMSKVWTSIHFSKFSFLVSLFLCEFFKLLNSFLHSICFSQLTLFTYLFIFLLIVGTNMGDVMVWDIGSRERIAHRNFKVWELGVCSVALQAWISKCSFTAFFKDTLSHGDYNSLILMQASLSNEYTASVNRVVWSPDGTLCSMFYQVYSPVYFALIFTEYFSVILLPYIQICKEF